ncbi:serine/threonine protein kinase [Streptomyces sp. NBC_01537]
MGLVWRARDTMLHREVALKEVRPPEDAQEGERQLRERVLREARALARVQHPNVVTIHHIVDQPGLPHPWLVMELVEGGSLQDRLEHGPLSPAEAARVGRGVLAGLRAAHAEGVHHRDVKPANVMLRRDGTPVLTDFGIATLRDATRLTSTGGLIGSPEFIAPERIRGEEGNPASDLWSLGMLLYVAVEGRHPLRRENSLATLVAVMDEPLPPPIRSGALTPVLLELLVRDTAARPDADRLDRLLADVAGGGTLGGTVPLVTLTGPAPAPAPAADSPTRPLNSRARASDPAPAPAPVRQRRRRRWTGVLAVPAAAVMVPLIGLLAWHLIPPGVSIGSVGLGSSGSGAQTSNVNLLTPAGVRSVIKAVRTKVGSTKVVKLSLYPQYASVTAPTKADKTEYDQYDYRDGELTRTDIGAGTRKTSDPLIDLAKVNWDALPGLLKQADKKLNVPKPQYRYVLVVSGSIDKVPSLMIYLSDKYGAGYLETDLKGRVTRVNPKGS